MGGKVAKGQKIRGYEIMTELGKGAFGVVHKAKKADGRFCAIKSLLNSTEKQVQEKELEMAKTISEHDNIVSIIDHFIDLNKDGSQEIYIVMEFCESGDLDQYCIKHKPDIMERFNYMVDMARGVNYLHSIKVCHRDLKPQNVLLTRKGDRLVCKITDFGISKVQVSPDVLFSTQCGSLPFIAPEIVNGAQYNFSVDVFSLGLLFFAVAILAIVKVGSKNVLLPVIIEGNRWEMLNTVIRAGKYNKSQFVDKFFNSYPELGALIFSMVLLEPEKRPKIDLVIAKVAEVKGELKAVARRDSGSDAEAPPVRPSLPPKLRATTAQDEAMAELQKQNEMLMQALARLHRAASGGGLSKTAKAEEEEENYHSFEKDAVDGVINVRRGVFDSGYGFSPETMGSFQSDATKGVIQVIDGRTYDSGIAA